MAASKKSIVAIAFAAIVLLGAAYRFLQILPYPMGGGNSQESPDKRFTASASDMTDCGFFSGKRSYYEFTIETGSRQVIRRIVIPEPPEGMINWRGEGTIQWAADSSRVTYSFRGTTLVLDVGP